VEHAGWSPTEGDNSKKVLTSKDDNFFRKIVLNLAGHSDEGALLVIVIYRTVMAFEKKMVSVCHVGCLMEQTNVYCCSNSGHGRNIETNELTDGSSQMCQTDCVQEGIRGQGTKWFQWTICNNK
jgi:hypothetical protein